MRKIIDQLRYQTVGLVIIGEGIVIQIIIRLVNNQDIMVIEKIKKYLGLNIYNEEDGNPKNCEIKDIGLGFLHDIVLVED